MASKKTLGIFFGSQSLSIVETEKKEIKNFFEASHSLFDENEQFSTQNLPDDIKLTAIVQKSLRDKKIDTDEVYLSLPSKDVIIRSFVIPWMAPSEIKNVVDFEARRYLPFKLDELSTAYHATTLVEKKIRQIRIVFLAARKDVLERYCSILEQSDLDVVSIEPAAVSILRSLLFKKIIKKQESFALLQASKKEGNIIIVDKSIPQFARDFKLFTGGSGAPVDDSKAAQSKLLSEIRISLDYYRRQQSPSNIEKIIFITPNPSDDISKKVSESLGIKAEVISSRSALGVSDEVNIGALNAFGASIRKSISFPIDADFSTPRERPAVEEKKVFVESPPNFVTTAKIAIACLGIIAFAFFRSNSQVANKENEISRLTAQLGKYKVMEISDLTKKQEETLKKLESYKNVRFSSNVAFFLDRIPRLLPNGAWLTELNIAYQSGTSRARRRRTVSEEESDPNIPSIEMSGYVYDEDLDRQLEIVNSIIVSIKEDKDFSNIFNTIEMSSASRDTINEFTVTKFAVNCR